MPPAAAPSTAIAKKVSDRSLFQVLWRFARAMDQLHVKRHKCVPRVAHQQDDAGAGQFSRRHEVFAANPVPKSSFHALLGEIDVTR